MYCQNCGKEVQDDWKVCPNCGSALNGGTDKTTLQKDEAEKTSDKVNEKGIKKKSKKESKKESKKKPFFKKIWFWIVVVIVVFILFCCSGSDEESEEEPVTENVVSEENEIEEDVEDVADEEVAEEDDEEEQEVNPDELPIYSLDYLTWYLEDNNIELDGTTKKEIKKMGKIMEEETDLESAVYLEEDAEDRYGVTREQTELLYIGETKDNRPDGSGKIFRMVSASEMQEENGIAVDDYLSGDEESLSILLVYVGEFDNGYYDGYGWKFGMPFTNMDDLYNSLYERDISADYVHTTDDVALNLLNSCNPVAYMGNFEKSEYCGEGALIDYPIRYVPQEDSDEYMETVFGRNVEREIYISTGEFKDGLSNGEGKIYVQGMILYEGEEKDGNYNGNGTLYYPKSTQIKYEGEWRNGEYDGKGTLYDENGEIEYSGEWDMGDYAK